MLFQKTFQMPNKLIDHCEDLDPYELYVLAVVIRMTIGYNKSLDEWVSIKASDITRTSARIKDRAARAKLQDLVRKGYLETRHNGPGRPNDYRLAGWLYDLGERELRHEMPETPAADAADPGTKCHPTPARNAGDPGTKCRRPRHEMPETPARNAGGNNKGSLNPSLNPTLNPTAKPARAGARAAAVFALQENRFTAEEAGELADAHGPEAVMLSIERCDFRSAAVGWKPVRSRREWIRGDLTTPGGYEIPEGFISSADREAARRRKAEQEAKEAREREEESAEERRQREEWERYDQIFNSLPPEDRQILHDNAKQFFKADNQFLYHRFTDLEKQGVSPPEMPIGVRAAYLDCRNRLLAERLNEESIAAES